MTCTKIEDITDHLTTLPLTLDAHYNEAWERCTGGSDVLRSHRAKLILMWISCAGLVLTVKTLREAPSLSGCHSGEGDITDKEIISSCAGFLTLDQSSTPHPYHVLLRRGGEVIIVTRPPRSNLLAEKWRTWTGGSNEALEEVSSLIPPFASPTPLPTHISRSGENDCSLGQTVPSQVHVCLPRAQTRCWPVALSGFASVSIGLPVSMNVSKVWPRIAWNFCSITCLYGIVGVAVSVPGRRLTVVRLGVFAYHVFLRCTLLLLFVKAKQ